MRKNKALALALAAAMTASMTPITAMADETEGLTSYYTYQTAVNDILRTECAERKGIAGSHKLYRWTSFHEYKGRADSWCCKGVGY